MHEQRLFFEFWHLIAHRCELAQPGDFLKVSVYGHDVVVANDGGNIIAFDNICPHRGARIVDADFGNRPLTCPYHGWTLSGGKPRIPQRAMFDEADLAKVRYNMYATAWCGDFLFVSPAPAQALEAQLEGLASLLMDIGASIGSRYDFNAMQFECNWKIAVENALEPYHLDLVHRDTLGKMGLPAQPRNEYHGPNSVAYFEVGDNRMRKSLERLGRYFELPYQFSGYLALYIFPFTMLSSTYGLSYSMQMFCPGAQAGQTAFYTRVLSAPLAGEGGQELAESLFKSTVEMNRKVFDEDHAICKRITKVFPDDRDMVYGASEEKIRHFHQAYLQALGEPGPASV